MDPDQGDLVFTMQDARRNADETHDLLRCRAALMDAIDVRHEAVVNVDRERGYTAEFAPDPDEHRAAYDEREDALRERYGC